MTNSVRDNLPSLLGEPKRQIDQHGGPISWRVWAGVQDVIQAPLLIDFAYADSNAIFRTAGPLPAALTASVAR